MLEIGWVDHQTRDLDVEINSRYVIEVFRKYKYKHLMDILVKWAEFSGKKLPVEGLDILLLRDEWLSIHKVPERNQALRDLGEEETQPIQH